MDFRIFFRFATSLVLIATGLCPADPADSGSGMRTKLIGMGSIEAGQVVQGESQGGNVTLGHVWYQRSYMHLGFSAEISDRIDVTMVGEALVHCSWTQSKDFLDDDVLQYLFYAHDVEGSYCFGAKEKPLLRIGVGVFPFKYDPDVRNLGEYLYRTGTYPPIMSSEFDFPLARLTGIKVSSTPIEALNFNVLFTSEPQVLPLSDFGLSALGDYTVARALTIGVGVFFSRLFPVNDKYTTPKNPTNLAPINAQNPDSIYYSFKGTKLMGRFSFDPKIFFPSDIFGPNDLKLYSEAAIIGLKNYPRFYDDLKRRVPVMVGFDVPTFKVMDVVAIEVERYTWNWPDSYTNSLFNGQVPQPDNVPGYDYKQNELKWSVYARKYLNRTFSVIGQVAYDHTRLESNAFIRFGAYFGDAMHKHGDWAWMLKTQFDF